MATILELGSVSVPSRPVLLGGSTMCAVELKYRARLGRRKAGGSTGARTSNANLLSDLLMICVAIVCGGFLLSP